MEPERLRYLGPVRVPAKGAYVLYWMQAAQRAEDNAALAYAASAADGLRLPLAVLFVLSDYPAATAPHYRWMLHGLRETAQALRGAGVGFRLERGDASAALARTTRRAALLVVDRSPSRWSIQARAKAAASAPCPVVEVDGESVVPEAAASPKREWSARTFRAKISGAIGLYAASAPEPSPCPRVSARSLGWDGGDGLFGAFDAATRPAYPGDRSGEQAYAAEPGPAAARRRLAGFVENALDSYDSDRNDPAKDGSSGLSPYLHFGQISPLSALRAARLRGGPGYPAFAEQLVVRRELCRNFVRYSPDTYDGWEGLPEWSRQALEAASKDRREYLYGPSEFEAAKTHDKYWNAAQEQLVRSGVIHNYMRMYWGKMILAWSRCPREAFATAIRLNDRYALDGRDPNGWAGVAWCFGLHDRPWPRKPAFGTVRSMSAAGLRRKFDADAYAAAWSPDGGGAAARI